METMPHKYLRITEQVITLTVCPYNAIKHIISNWQAEFDVII